MSSSLLHFLCSKEEVCLEMDEPISNLPKKIQGQFLIIDGDTDVEEPGTMAEGVDYCGTKNTSYKGFCLATF